MTKKESKDKRVNEILEAAVDVFLEKGYENTSMDSIAEKAGISKGGLYHHFVSKDILLMYANGKLMEPIDEMMSEAVAYDSAAGGLRFYIRTYLEYWLGHQKELVFFFLSMTKALNNSSLWKLYQTYTEKYINFFDNIFIKGIRLGEFIDHDTRGSAVTLMSALDGVMYYMVMDKKLDLESVCRMFEDKFISTVIIQESEEHL